MYDYTELAKAVAVALLFTTVIMTLFVSLATADL